MNVCVYVFKSPMESVSISKILIYLFANEIEFTMLLLENLMSSQCGAGGFRSSKPITISTFSSPPFVLSFTLMTDMPLYPRLYILFLRGTPESREPVKLQCNFN